MKKYLTIFLAIFTQANFAFACEQKDPNQKAPIYSGSSEEESDNSSQTENTPIACEN